MCLLNGSRAHKRSKVNAPVKADISSLLLTHTSTRHVSPALLTEGSVWALKIGKWELPPLPDSSLQINH